MRVQSLSVNEAVFHSSLEDADVGIHTHLTSLIVQILHSIQANVVRPYKDAFPIFTARKRSLRRLSFHRCCPSGHTNPWAHKPPRHAHPQHAPFPLPGHAGPPVDTTRCAQ